MSYETLVGKVNLSIDRLGRICYSIGMRVDFIFLCALWIPIAYQVIRDILRKNKK